jgi:hypothetical protein
VHISRQLRVALQKMRATLEPAFDCDGFRAGCPGQGVADAPCVSA